ncbi:zinc-dependent alcohol dehydrogenase family protein [Arenibacterium halophilum]|nr:zinc-dependent alcohol dehydrogenase family protein [Arenibacterium halophilum]
MKRALFRRHGAPQDVIEIVEEPDPHPGPKQVRVRNKVMTINPADLLSIEGRYGAEPIDLPATPGVGAWGIVDAVGAGVTRLAVGDAVLPVGGGFWSDTVILHERMAPKAPEGIDPQQAALMRANPATAHLMLSDMVDLAEGDWILQNAANSNVGRMVIRFARERGLNSINIVRRADVAKALTDDGATAIIVDDGETDLVAAIQEAAKTAPKLALDAVGGTATGVLAASVADRGTVVAYGLLSGQDHLIAPRDTVFRDVRLRGFWLFDWYRTATPDQVRDLNDFLARKMSEGVLQTEVAATYPLTGIKEALAHAARPGRNGKILLTAGDDDA